MKIIPLVKPFEALTGRRRLRNERSRHTRHRNHMLVYRWVSVCDAGPPLNQHMNRINARYSLLDWTELYSHDVSVTDNVASSILTLTTVRSSERNTILIGTRHCLSVVLILGQRRRLCPATWSIEDLPPTQISPYVASWILHPLNPFTCLPSKLN